MIELSFVAGLVIGMAIVMVFELPVLHKLQKRVESLQDTLNMCNDRDD